MLDLTDAGCIEAMTFIEQYDAEKASCAWLGDGNTSEQIIQILQRELLFLSVLYFSGVMINYHGYGI